MANLGYCVKPHVDLTQMSYARSFAEIPKERALEPPKSIFFWCRTGTGIKILSRKGKLFLLFNFVQTP